MVHHRSEPTIISNQHRRPTCHEIRQDKIRCHRRPTVTNRPPKACITKQATYHDADIHSRSKIPYHSRPVSYIHIRESDQRVISHLAISTSCHKVRMPPKRAETAAERHRSTARVKKHIHHRPFNIATHAADKS